MITRAAFTEAFSERMRHLLQKHEREMRARAAADAGDIETLGGLIHANTHLDAAINELADFVFDTLEEKAPLEPCV
jgi:hypothetical protein